MSGVSLIVRSEFRRRWRSLAFLLVLIGVVGAIVLVCASGARRSDSALGRLLQHTRNAHVSVEVGPEFFAAISALPQVEVAAPASYMFVIPDGSSPDGLLTIAGTDARFGSDVNRPLLLDGRLASPNRADEVVVNSVVAETLDVGVGETIRLASLSPAQLERMITAGEEPDEPAGPAIIVSVVGVGVTAEDFANRSPILLFTPAFYATYRNQVGHFDDILAVRLRAGIRDFDAFRQGVERVVPTSEGALLEPSVETIREVKDATDVESMALLAVAAVAALAGLVVTGLALARHLEFSASNQPVLGALGMARRERWLARAVPGFIVSIGGSILAVLLAIVASPTMPVGFARRVEPSPGVDVDWVVLGIGFVSLLTVVAALVAVVSWAAIVRITGPQSSPVPARRVVELLIRLGARPPLLVGARQALDRVGRRSAMSVRSPLIAVVIGTSGVVAAMTFGAGLGRTVSESEAYGWNWDVSVGGPFEREGVESLASDLATSDDAVGVASLHVLPVRLGGVDVQSYELTVRRGNGFVSVTEGRAPSGPDEMLLGSQTLDRMDAEIGDRVQAVGLQGGTVRDITIVGRGVFPEFVHPAVPDSDTASYNDFALTEGAGIDTFAAEAGGEYFGTVLIDWPPNADAGRAASALTEQGLEVETANRPTNLDNLARVRIFPVLLAALLSILVGATVAHALVTSTQRQRGDLALLRALGFVTRQVRVTFAAHAGSLAVIGLVIGVPAGLVAGRLVWATVADRIGVDNELPLPLLAVFITIIASLALANVLAIIPAHSATRSRVVKLPGNE